MLAARLSEERARSICLIEAGPDYGPVDSGSWPTELVDARVMPPPTHDWGTGGEDGRTLGARVVGGCSAHNACMVMEGTPADYDEWGEEWAHARFAAYLARAKSALCTAPANTADPHPLHVAFLAAAERLGFPRLEDANAPATTVGVASFPANVVGTTRWSAAFAYLDAARSRPNLTIRAGTLVDRALLDGTRARGIVTAEGEEVEAPLVVLAAGAYMSPAILQRSGIGPEELLRERGIPVVEALPVGEELLDHYGSGVRWHPTEELREAAAEHELRAALPFEAHGVLKAASSSCAPGSFDLHLLSWAVSTRPGPLTAQMPVFLMKPRSTGRVQVRSRDPRDLPLVERGFLRCGDDLQPLLEGFELIRALARTPPLAGLVGEELVPGPVDTAGFLRQSSRNYFHPAGTCGMGRVVDTGGRVRGVEGLAVADASIMPTIPRANTNLTTAAIAEKLAETL